MTSNTYIPNILWYQTRYIVIMTIKLNKTSDLNLTLTESNISFNCMSNNTKYAFEFEFFENIVKDESNYEVEDNHIKVFLKKKITEDEETTKWSLLTKDKNLYKNNIKVDWNNWVDSDCEDEEDVQEQGNPFGGNMDFQSMMQSMGGLGNMQMPNMEDFGDDEDEMPDTDQMPDLENENDEETEDDMCHECNA
jgi:hypothetical protein